MTKQFQNDPANPVETMFNGTLCHSSGFPENSLEGPHGFWASGEKDHLFSGIWGALVIIFRHLGSKRIVLWI